jgi:hypothetical protein
MQLYDSAETERIEKIKTSNDKMEEFFNEKREEWNNKVNPLFDVIKNRITLEMSEKIMESQSLALTFRQMITDQITFFLNKRSREETKYKKIRQDKFLFYSIGTGGALKTNSSEKALLMDAHLAESDRSMQLIESYIEFLRDVRKNLEGFGYTIKNMIDLMNALGR